MFASRLFVALFLLLAAPPAPEKGKALAAANLLFDFFFDYVPKEVSGDLERDMRAANFDEDADVLSFQSAESKSARDGPIFNRIKKFVGKRFTVWSMRQAADGLRQDPQHRSLVIVAVDRDKAAYYFEAKPKPVASGELPEFTKPSVPCLRCHANGPRAIRPESSFDFPKLSTANHKRLQGWNEEIRNQGVVTNFVGKNRALVSSLVDGDALLPESLCTECHSTQSGVRGPLFRSHEASIRFLLTHADHESSGFTFQTFAKGHTAMPPESSPALSDAERDCLLSWLDRKSSPATCSQKNMVTQESTKAGVDAQIFVGRKTIAIQGHALQSNSGLAFNIPVAGLASGNAVRDWRMRQLLSSDGLSPNIKAEVSFKSPDTLQLALSLNGVAKNYQGAVDCVPSKIEVGERPMISCALKPLTLDMRHHHIEPPQLLGMRVASSVVISGTFTLTSEVWENALRGLRKGTKDGYARSR